MIICYVSFFLFCHGKILVNNIAGLFSRKTIKYVDLNSQKEVAYCISWAVGKEAMDTPEYIQQFTERILKCVWHKRNDHRPKSLDDFYCDDKIGKAQKNLFHVQFSLHFQSRLETQFYIQLVCSATLSFTPTSKNFQVIPYFVPNKGPFKAKIDIVLTFIIINLLVLALQSREWLILHLFYPWKYEKLKLKKLP